MGRGWKGLSPLLGSSGISLVTDALLSRRPFLGLSADVSELDDARLSKGVVCSGSWNAVGMVGVECRRCCCGPTLEVGGVVKMLLTFGRLTFGMLLVSGKILLSGGRLEVVVSRIFSTASLFSSSASLAPDLLLLCARGMPPRGESRLLKFGNPCWKGLLLGYPSKLVSEVGPPSRGLPWPLALALLALR